MGLDDLVLDIKFLLGSPKNTCKFKLRGTRSGDLLSQEEPPKAHITRSVATFRPLRREALVAEIKVIRKESNFEGKET